MAIFALIPTATMAQGIAVPDTRGAPRYQMQPVEGGVARLDTQTGEVALCRIKGEAISCADAASHASLDDLNRRLDALGARVDALEAGSTGRAPVRPGADEVDEAIGRMQRFFRAFGEVIRDMEREFSAPDAPAETTPERT